MLLCTLGCMCLFKLPFSLDICPNPVGLLGHIVVLFLDFKEPLYCSLREGNGTPLKYSCVENPMDRGAWWAVVHGVTKSRTRLKRLSSSSSNTKYLSHSVKLTDTPSVVQISQIFCTLLFCTTLSCPWYQHSQAVEHLITQRPPCHRLTAYTHTNF